VLDEVLTQLAVFQPEVLTVLTSLNGTAFTEHDIASAAAKIVSGAEVQIHDGGQPLYPILVGAE
jgi:dihydroxyacetone kinase-like predicted kinase